MPVNEASSEETPYGRYITSDGWFVLNIADALAVRNDEKGGATYPLESRESPFRDVGVRVTVLSPGEPNALYHAEGVQEGFLVLSGECNADRGRGGTAVAGVGLLPLSSRNAPRHCRSRQRAVFNTHARRSAGH